jgi:hypothetical protein
MVGEQTPVDDVGELAFKFPDEAAAGLCGGFGFVSLR